MASLVTSLNDKYLSGTAWRPALVTPREFAEVAIEDASSGYEPPYRQFLASGEP